MLSKPNQLKKDKEFRKVFKQSKPLYFGNLVLRFSKNPAINTSRFGFVVSNKIDKRATRRNGIKRRLRAIARNVMPQINTGYDLIIIVNKNYTFPYSIKEIESDVVALLKKGGLIR